MPVGEGGSILLARALIKKGAGIPAAVAMMLAAPVVNIPALAAGLGSGGESTAFWFRTGVGAGFAVLFALLISVEHEPDRVVLLIVCRGTKWEWKLRHRQASTAGAGG